MFRSILRFIAVDRFVLPVIWVITLFLNIYANLLIFIILLFKYNFMLNKVLWHGPHKSETRVFQSHVLYKNKITELFLDTNDEYMKGFVHGMLLYPEMRKLIRRFKLIRWFIKLFMKKFNYEVPLKIEQELKGLITGYNQNVSKYDQITYEQALEYHVLVDQWIACSVIVHQIDDKKYIGRNMDFSPFGTGGSDSVLVRTANTTYLTVPGFVGLISAWKNTEEGPLCCFLNISYAGKHLNKSKDKTITPITFNAKVIFEEITKFADIKNKEFKGLPCHLTFVGSQYFQKNVGVHDDNIFDLTNTPIEYGERVKYWTTFNYSYPQHFNNATSSYSRDRANATHVVMCVNPFNKMNALLAISSDILNVPDTIHSFYMDLSTKEMYLSCDNGFAADGPYVKTDMFAFEPMV